MRAWILLICSLEGTSWLQGLFFPCPFKLLTGVACPGCGFQRSLLALLQGRWLESYALYPPTVPLLMVLLYGILRAIFGFDHRGTGLKIVAVACGWLVIGVYLLRLGHTL